MPDTPLLSPGLHDVSEGDLDNHFLSAFPHSASRPRLIAGFRAYLAELASLPLRFEVWLDGSFTTTKVDPGDIDLVVFASTTTLNAQPPHIQQRLWALLADRANLRLRFGCDVLFSPEEDAGRRSYWRGWYGFDRNENPKGIARLVVNP